MSQKISPKSPGETKASLESYGLPRAWIRKGNSRRIVIQWKVLAGYSVLALLVGWLAISCGLYFFIKNRAGFTEVRYSHVVGLPFTWKKYNQAKGEFWLKEGIRATEEGRWRDAFDSLRLGLPFRPENEEARLLLAKIYFMARRPDLARVVLIEGLPHHSDQTEYLRTVLGFLFQQQADEAVVEVTNGLLAQGTVKGDIRRMVGVARGYAYFNRDQFERAQQAFKSEGLAQSPEARFIEARTAWETGSRESAILLLRDLQARAPQDRDIYQTLVYYLRDIGRLDEARRVTLARQLAQPDNPDAYVDFIAICAAAGQSERQRSAEADFLVQFAKDMPALLKLAVQAAKEGNANLAWQIVERCTPQTNEMRSAVLLALEAELTRNAFANASAKLAQVEEMKLPWTEPQRISLTGLQAVALAGQGMNTEAQESLRQVVSSSAITPAGLTSLANHLDRIGDAGKASELLRRAVELDPLYQPALVELLRWELKQQNLAESLPLAERLPTMRKPPNALMFDIIANLESDRYLFVKARSSAIKALQAKLDAVGATPASAKDA